MVVRDASSELLVNFQRNLAKIPVRAVSEMRDGDNVDPGTVAVKRHIRPVPSRPVKSKSAGLLVRLGEA